MKKIRTEDCKIIQPHFPENAVIGNGKEKIFSFKENGKTYQAKNVNEKIGICLQIDGKLYCDTDSNNVKKCDNGLLLEDGRFFLIELKGSDIKRGCEQILKTCEKIKNDYTGFNFDFYGRLIYSRVNPKMQTFLQITSRNFGAKKFAYHEKSLKENIF